MTMYMIFNHDCVYMNLSSICQVMFVNIGVLVTLFAVILFLW